MTIPGNEPLAARISTLTARGTLSHAIILTGQGDLTAAARYTAAAMQCEGAHRPCGVCSACTKVARRIHPDVITVEDTEHKNISMDILRTIRADAYILPNEGARKIYIFPDCERLDPKAQNVLLKVLEEGPPHAAFLFCAKNSAQLLPTIRSRAVEWTLSPVTPPAEVSEASERLCLLLCEKKSSEIIAFCAELENGKLKREELSSLLSGTRESFVAALAATYGAAVPSPLANRIAREMDRRHIAAMIDILQQFIRDCGYNISVGHLSGALAVALGA